MNKREFITSVALLGTALPVLAREQSQAAAFRTPALLTLSGRIGKSNRGPLDPALDQLMKKQGVKFDKAQTFDFAALLALPAVTIKPTLEYDNKAHALRGPLLLDVVKAAGATPSGNDKLLLRAIDGYAVLVPAADLRRYQFIIATHLDGQPLPLGGLGPLWAIYDADRHADMLAKPLNERFGSCPWGLYHIEVQ